MPPDNICNSPSKAQATFRLYYKTNSQWYKNNVGQIEITDCFFFNLSVKLMFLNVCISLFFNIFKWIKNIWKEWKRKKPRKYLLIKNKSTYWWFSWEPPSVAPTLLMIQWSRIRIIIESKNSPFQIMWNLIYHIHSLVSTVYYKFCPLNSWSLLDISIIDYTT